MTQPYPSMPTGQPAMQPPTPQPQPWNQNQTPFYQGGTATMPNGGTPGNSAPYLDPRTALTQPVYGINAVDAFKRYFKKYATFSGRASRGEYWWVMFWFFIIDLVLLTLSYIFVDADSVLTVISRIISLGTFIPTLAVTARRYHDANKSGLWILASVGPVIAGMISMIIAVLRAVEILFPRTSDTYPRGRYFDFDSRSTLFTSTGTSSHSSVISSLTENEENALVASMYSWILIGSILIIGGLITGIVFALLPSKSEGVRFDSPQLPYEYTVFAPGAQAPVSYFAPPAAGYGSYPQTNFPNTGNTMNSAVQVPYNQQTQPPYTASGQVPTYGYSAGQQPLFYQQPMQPAQPVQPVQSPQTQYETFAQMSAGTQAGPQNPYTDPTAQTFTQFPPQDSTPQSPAQQYIDQTVPVIPTEPRVTDSVNTPLFPQNTETPIQSSAGEETANSIAADTDLESSSNDEDSSDTSEYRQN